MRCSLVREFTSYARAVRQSAGVVWRQPAALDVLQSGKGEGGCGQRVRRIRALERFGTTDLCRNGRVAGSQATRARGVATLGTRSPHGHVTWKTHRTGRIMQIIAETTRSAPRRHARRSGRRPGTHPWYTGAAARATVVASLRREEDILPVSGRSRLSNDRRVTTAIVFTACQPTRSSGQFHFEKNSRARAIRGRTSRGRDRRRWGPTSANARPSP